MRDTCTTGRDSSSLVRMLVPFLLLASLAGGCARARAADVPVGPPLAIPAPPERVLAPIEAEPLVASAPGRTDTPTVAPEVTAEQRPPVAPARPPAERARQTPAASAPAAAPATTPAPPEVTRQVRPQAAAEEAELRKRLESLLDTTAANLNRATNASKQQIDEIRALQEEARKALYARDYPFAEIQATKALNLSKALVR